MSETKSFFQLTGRNREHLAAWSDHCELHRELIAPLQALCERGREVGLDISVASGFRSFERQLNIWNTKARGERAVLDSAGQPLEMQRLDDTQKVFAILRWSALPGTSRHHWGSDFDIWDAAAVPADYCLQLHTDEYCKGGPFSALNVWLQEEVDAHPDDLVRTGFFRPYTVDGDGIAPEPWHLSYAPLARRFEALCDSAALKHLIADSDIELKAAVLAHWDTIYTRFIAITE
ncbi:MAG: M15 family metallopeptidase [Porticoccaceae bacterium]|nr:M15 family metallopeptidase [Porticoccaceae bacterium]